MARKPPPPPPPTPEERWAQRRDAWADKIVDAAAGARQRAEDVAKSPRTAEVRSNATGFLATLRDSLKETTSALREGLHEGEAKPGGTAAGSDGDDGEAPRRPRPRPRPTR